MAGNSGENHMQENMIVEILSRLPVKSLVRFKNVCKFWYNLFNNSNFITKHLHNHGNTRLLMQRYTYNIQKYALASYPCEKIANTPSPFDDLDNLEMPRILSVTGPFNGILCVWDRSHLALWNPAMREYRPLRVPQPKLASDFKAYCFHSGIGLDPATNHYKVVWIRYFWDDKNDDPYYPTVIAVYTLNTDSWTLLEVDLFGKGFIHDSLCNTYMNGVYYWLTSDDDYNYMLFSFDMSSDVFRETLAPSDIPESHLGFLALCNDYIAMFVYDTRVVEKQFDIWFMKKEGCWTKQFKIGPFQELDGPLGFWTNGEILFETTTSQLVIYNPNNEEIKYIGPYGNNCAINFFIYKESLVSLKGGNECWEGDIWSEFKAFSDFIRLS